MPFFRPFNQINPIKTIHPISNIPYLKTNQFLDKRLSIIAYIHTLHIYIPHSHYIDKKMIQKFIL